MFLLYKKIEIIVWFYAFLLITFIKKNFGHLIPLVYKIQKDIHIISKLF